MRSAFREINYEVHLAEGNRWSIEAVLPRKADALTFAQRLMAGKRGEAVRVVKETEGKKPEVILEEEREGKEVTYTVSAIEEAPPCAGIHDFYAYPARLAASRLFRSYLDGKGWTALEILHDRHKLSDLIRDERFVIQGLQRVAAVQARVAGDDAGERFDALWKAFGELRERARDAAPTDLLLARLDTEGPDAALAAIVAQGVTPEEQPIRAGAVLAAGLARYGDWVGKAEWLLDLLERGPGAPGVRLIDEALAEILDGSEAIRDLLGGQADLASALTGLIGLATGRRPERAQEGSAAARLAQASARHPLAETRKVLLSRVAANLSGIRPLTREDETADRQALVAISGRLLAPAGLWGGQAMAEAVTLRTRVLFGKEGEDLSLADAIRMRLDTLPARAQKLGYLLDLTGTRLWEPGKALILDALVKLLAGLETVRDLPTPGADVARIRNTIADLLPRMEASALPPEAGQLFSAKMTAVLKAAGVSADVAEKGTAERAPKSDDKPSRTATGRRRLAAGEYLFRQGDMAEEAYVLMSGEIEVLIDTGNGERSIDTVHRGELLGEMAMVDDKPRMASARATTDSELMVIPRDVFNAKLDRALDSDHVVRQLVETFVTRLRNRPVL